MLKNRLLELRKQKNIRQEDLAKRIGIARTTYAMYEQGKRQPDYETLQKIADFHDVTFDFLLGRSADPKLTKAEDDKETWKLLKKLESLPPDQEKQLKKIIDVYLDGLPDTEDK